LLVSDRFSSRVIDERVLALRIAAADFHDKKINLPFHE
jgi:hypothetical protein